MTVLFVSVLQELLSQRHPNKDQIKVVNNDVMAALVLVLITKKHLVCVQWVKWCQPDLQSPLIG